MVRFVLGMELLPETAAVWSTAITTPGGLCAMITGMIMMLMLFAGS